MNIGKKLFPYPVLNNDPNYSQFQTSKFELLYEDEQINGKYVLKNIRCELTNDAILNLIDENRAKIVCLIESPLTMFRKCFDIGLEPFDLEIDLKYLSGKVSVSAVVIALEDIEDYYSSDFYEEYLDYTFDVEKNDILAVDDGFIRRIDFDDEEDKKKSSIFLVIKNDNPGEELTKVVYDRNLIKILLPGETWNHYDKTKNSLNYREIYFSMLAIPALSQAIDSIKSTGGVIDVDTLCIEYRWFDSFAKQYKNVMGEELTNEIFNKMNIYEVAQLIMDTPVKKAVDNIFEMSAVIMGGEDYDD